MGHFKNNFVLKMWKMILGHLLHLKRIMTLNGSSWWLFFACVCLNVPWASWANCTVNREQQGGGAMLNKEAGLWLVRGGTERNERSQQPKQWLNGTEREGGGRRVGKRETQRQQQMDCCKARNTLTEDRACVCVCMQRGCVYENGCERASIFHVLWNLMHWAIIFLRKKKGYGQVNRSQESEHLWSSHFSCFYRARAGLSLLSMQVIELSGWMLQTAAGHFVSLILPRKRIVFKEKQR